MKFGEVKGNTYIVFIGFDRHEVQSQYYSNKYNNDFLFWTYYLFSTIT
jgi:hypothetical protein